MEKALKKVEKMPRTISMEESEKLLKALKTFYNAAGTHPKAIRNYAMAVIMLDAGLRVGELVKLKKSDLIVGEEPVKSIRITGEIAKNKTERIVPVTNRIKEAVLEMQTTHMWKSVTESPLWAFAETIFGPHITVRQVQRIIGITGWVATGRPITPHMLRHTYATRMMRITNSRVLQELLGHKQLTSTQVYTHPNHDDLEQAVKSLDKLTGNSQSEKPKTGG